MWVFASAVHVFLLLCSSLFAVTCQRTDALLRWENAKYSEGSKEIIRNKSLSQAGQLDFEDRHRGRRDGKETFLRNESAAT